MVDTQFDDGEGTRLHLNHDGAIEIERYLTDEPSVVLTSQEAMDIATSVIRLNTPPDLESKVFCEDCCYHWPEGKCKKLLERPERIMPELVFRQAECRKVNRGFNCGYHRPRKDKKR